MNNVSFSIYLRTERSEHLIKFANMRMDLASFHYRVASTCNGTAWRRGSKGRGQDLGQDAELREGFIRMEVESKINSCRARSQT
jgi:hypothetical protein